jgi:hypothetical protein
MRLAFLVVVAFSACDGGGDGGGRPAPPSQCRCTADDPVLSEDDCCDSVTCWFDEEEGDWQVTFCDPAPPDPCDQCTPDEICVQRYGGVCGFGPATACEPKTVECPANACSPACEAAYCPSPYQCMTRPSCGDESPLAFTCYGP